MFFSIWYRKNSIYKLYSQRNTFDIEEKCTISKHFYSKKTIFWIKDSYQLVSFRFCLIFQRKAKIRLLFSNKKFVFISKCFIMFYSLREPNIRLYFIIQRFFYFLTFLFSFRSVLKFLNVFVSFRFRNNSISKLYYRRTCIIVNVNVNASVTAMSGSVFMPKLRLFLGQCNTFTLHIVKSV